MKFERPKAAEEAFGRLKRALIEAHVLAVPNVNHQFVVECDASGTGVGDILMQDRQPIAYFSKSLSEKTQTKST